MDNETTMYERNKYFQLYKVCKKWVKNLQMGVDINEKLEKSGIQHIAIYGWGEIAWMLSDEIDDKRISYIIDRNAENISIKYPVYSINEDLPKVDMIIVSLIDQYDNIANNLAQITNMSICSLDDLICEDKWKV